MMGGGLPVTMSSTVWCRVHESQMHLWRAMISGPEGTPYEGGLFIFDILCPNDYPNTAPKVNLRTTGAGSVRFNPNLYNCGKACLSPPDDAPSLVTRPPHVHVAAGLPLAAGHVAGRRGRVVAREDLHAAAGPHVGPGAHPRAGPVLQRAGVRADPRHAAGRLAVARHGRRCGVRTEHLQLALESARRESSWGLSAHPLF